jgi:hypothetical protein
MLPREPNRMAVRLRDKLLSSETLNDIKEEVKYKIYTIGQRLEARVLGVRVKDYGLSFSLSPISLRTSLQVPEVRESRSPARSEAERRRRKMPLPHESKKI